MTLSHLRRYRGLVQTIRDKKPGEFIVYLARVGLCKPLWDLYQAAEETGKRVHVEQLSDMDYLMNNGRGPRFLRLRYKVTVL
jgi:hypothetical protein